MRTERLSTLEHDARRVVAELHSDKTALIIGDDGTPAAYLVDPETYNAACDRLHLLEAVALAERQVAEGNTLTHAQVKKKMARWLK
jgi:PHD/YefM family antitoxin component YafN of YafNO toxin-antitoxin module